MHVVVRSLLTMILGVGAAALPFACGDDSADPSSDADDDDSADDDSADDDSADDDSADDDGPGGTFQTDAGTIQVVFEGEGAMCGSESCQNGTLYEDGEVLFPLTGCCADEDEEACGLDFTLWGLFFGLDQPGCEALNQPGSPDPSCESSPPLEAAYDPVNGIELEGCCQASGKCGYSASFEGFGFGCVSPTRFGYDEGADCDFEP